MKASEMFEQLGYKCNVFKYRNKDCTISYVKCLNGCCYLIEFDLEKERVCACENGIEAMIVDISTLKAIHQQLKELEWLDE